jgi:predicted ATPase
MNNWYVITGSPCSGKSTVLSELKKKGFRIIDEAARILIDQELAKGRTIKEIRKDERQFQQEVLTKKIEIESSLPKNEVIFFDRAIPDTEAYYQLQGYVDQQLQKVLQKCIYKKVFLFEILPFEQDYARTEDPNKLQKLHDLLKVSYKKRNIPIVEVPVLSIAKRVDLVISNM